MDIAFVSNVAYPFVKGGAEKRIYEIGTRLAANSHDITVYTRDYWDGPKELEYDEMTYRAVSPARDLYAGDRRSIKEAIEFAIDLTNTLYTEGRDHDLIVASVFPYFPVITARLVATLNDTPLVTTWHEVWNEYWSDYLGRLAPFGKATEILVANLPQHPVAVSGTTADRLAKIGPSRDDIQVVSNGIDMEYIESTPPATHGFDVLFVGRLVPEKNVDILLKAFNAAVTDNRSTLGIIGDGPERSRLESFAQKLPMSDRITFLGFVEDYRQVVGHMRAADVFVSLSTREGFGITNLEAMGAGCTVVAADHHRSAASEVVDGGGFIVPPNEGSVATVLRKVLTGTEPRVDPKSVAEEYEWKKIASQAEWLYSEISQDG